MSDIHRAYHAKRTVRVRGCKLAGWSPKDVAKLATLRPTAAGQPSKAALDHGVAVLQQRLPHVVVGRGDVLAVWLAIREASDRERAAR